MKKSNTRVKLQAKRKTNPVISKTIYMARKNKAWKEILDILTGPSRRYSVLNLKEIDKKTTPGDTVIIPGTVLSSGELTKKLRICALSFSKSAIEKIKKHKSE